ncbi:hypothetical protein [Saccharothrix sp. ALI-22-I]|uniref:hypothetical protein n=1 Tax=Saccharothrix sp. ALI-22-I TaxID=1933778 RepID=UPI0015C329B7|nr:hypothetical protein [Saccharothrix sp. ALI-22-I]
MNTVREVAMSNIMDGPVVAGVDGSDSSLGRGRRRGRVTEVSEVPRFQAIDTKPEQSWR